MQLDRCAIHELIGKVGCQVGHAAGFGNYVLNHFQKPFTFKKSPIIKNGFDQRIAVKQQEIIDPEGYFAGFISGIADNAKRHT